VVGRLGQASEEANQASDEGKVYDIMKKIQVVGLALVALFAFSSLMAASASAVVTLLAEWLVGGKSIGAAVATNTEGELLFENAKSKGGLLCSGLFEGTIGPSGEDEVTMVWGLISPQKLIEELEGSGAVEGISCVSTGQICENESEIWPQNLPFKSLLVLDETTELFLDYLLPNANGKLPGYFILCLFLGASITELCEAAANTFGEVANAATDVETLGALNPLATCKGETGTGLIENNAGDIALIAAADGETLAVSE
jgi:hypothetical protein